MKKEYYTRLNGNPVNLSSEDAKRVIGELKRHYGDDSVPVGNGRAYFVKGGTIEHSMGPQPEITIESPLMTGVEKIAEEFGLPSE